MHKFLTLLATLAMLAPLAAHAARPLRKSRLPTEVRLQSPHEHAIGTSTELGGPIVVTGHIPMPQVFIYIQRAPVPMPDDNLALRFAERIVRDAGRAPF